MMTSITFHEKNPKGNIWLKEIPGFSIVFGLELPILRTGSVALSNVFEANADGMEDANRFLISLRVDDILLSIFYNNIFACSFLPFLFFPSPTFR